MSEQKNGIVRSFKHQVNYDKHKVPLQRLIVAGGYGTICGKINSEQIPELGGGEGLVTFHILAVERGEWAEIDAFESADAKGLRLATIREILTIGAGAMHIDLPRNLHTYDRIAYEAFGQTYDASILVNPYGKKERWLKLGLNSWGMTYGDNDFVLAADKTNEPTT